MSYKIFKGNHQYYHLNACVGNNGWTGISTYLEGYQAATIAMLESILDKKALEGSEIISGHKIQLYILLFLQLDIL